MLNINTLTGKAKTLVPRYLRDSMCVVQTPGCDFILGSKQREDACMVCGGQNTTCLHHKSVYQSNGLEAGRIHRLTHTHTQSYYLHDDSMAAVSEFWRFQAQRASRLQDKTKTLSTIQHYTEQMCHILNLLWVFVRSVCSRLKVGPKVHVFCHMSQFLVTV